MNEEKILETEDKIAIPEARIVKYQYLFDYFDAKEFLVKYWKTGDTKYIIKTTNALIGLWLQIKVEFAEKELKSKYYADVNKLDWFLENRKRIPSYTLLLSIYFKMQNKLKTMKILDITFPEPDMKDFMRSW